MASKTSRKESACTNEKHSFYSERDSKVTWAPPCSATLRGASLLPEEGSKLLKFLSVEASPTRMQGMICRGGACSSRKTNDYRAQRRAIRESPLRNIIESIVGTDILGVPPNKRIPQNKKSACHPERSRTFFERRARKKRKTLQRFAGSRYNSWWLF